ncbi:MAG: fimbria/pilus periplasmic chaperone, partial [Acidobacteriota bacterium]|nr:fimbria/pilus periplasmic chaperone [Acidobacteriota bacterium]
DAGFADIFLTARRVVLEGGKRTEGVTLMNASANRNTYRVVINYRDMQEDGSLTERNEAKAGETRWQDLLRFSPRQFVLEAGDSQLVRLSFNPPASLPDGEYRYFINFQLLPHIPEPTPSSQDKAQGITLQVLPTYALAIPVIYRKGRLEAKAALGEPSFQPAAGDKGPQLRVKLSRAGAASTYGQVRVVFAPDSGAEEEVALQKGLAVYAENDFRWLTLALRSPSNRAFKSGLLKATYTPDGRKHPESQLEIPVP